jgi:hypothetical protein
LAGLPYLLEIDHAVYRAEAFRRPPLSFQDSLEARQLQAIPAGTVNALTATLLLQYIAAGGTLTDDQGQPLLDTAALTAILTYYDNARKLGVLAENFQSWTARQPCRFSDQLAPLAMVTDGLPGEASLANDASPISAQRSMAAIHAGSRLELGGDA